MAYFHKTARLGFSVFLLALVLGGSLSAQNWPLEVKLSAWHQNVFDDRNTESPAYRGFGFPYFNMPDSIKGGFGLGSEFRFKLSESFRVLLQVNYDYMYLFQDDVLTEWKWAYWEDTYIEFLPGITVEEANRTLRYTSGDSIYSAVFVPQQRLKELRLATGLTYTHKLWNKLDGFIGLEVGASLYTRELRMTEKWTKRFKLDTLSTERFDYDYRYDLLHFAPSKNGTRFYLAPILGLKYALARNTDLELNYRYMQYIDRKFIEGIENLFQITGNSQKWFPLYSKYQLQLGIVFKY